MSNKEIAVEVIGRLSDDVSLRDIAREIEFVAGVREGFESYEREGGVSVDEAKKLVSEWAKKAAATK